MRLHPRVHWLTGQSLILLLIVCVAPILPALVVAAQTVTGPAPTASVGGRIATDGGPVANIYVTLWLPTRYGQAQMVAKTKTGTDGRFRLANLAAGKYFLVPEVPTYVITNLPPNDRRNESGLSITLNEGETHADVDFTLAPGGVITGRVTDAQGRPVARLQVRLKLLHQERRHPTEPAYIPQSVGDPPGNFRVWNGTSYATTDDRGAYRCFGLPAGRYAVGTGGSEEADGAADSVYSRGLGIINRDHDRIYYPMAYYPAATDIEGAGLVEVTAGGEVAGIDIKLGPRKSDTLFAISGRVVGIATAEKTGVNANWLSPDERPGHGSGSTVKQTQVNGRGEFRLPDLRPGRYLIQAYGNEPEGSYFGAVEVTITDADIGSVVVNPVTGLAVTGRLVIDNPPNGGPSTPLEGLYVMAVTDPAGGGPSTDRSTKLDSAGGFRIAGLIPGRIRFSLYAPNTNLVLAAVEKDGLSSRAAVQGGIFDWGRNSDLSIRSDAPNNNVILHALVGNSALMGKVIRSGGAWPTSTKFDVSYHREPSGSLFSSTETDDRGGFVIDRLPPGDYSINVTAITIENGKERAWFGRKRVTIQQPGVVNIDIMVTGSAQ